MLAFSFIILIYCYDSYLLFYSIFIYFCQNRSLKYKYKFNVILLNEFEIRSIKVS